MKSVKTATLVKGHLTPHDALQIYNGLDCALTVEIFEEVSGSNFENVRPAARLVYDFERATQAPALDMMLRGWRIDLFKRDQVVARLRRDKDLVQEILDEFVTTIWLGGRTPLDKRGKTPGLNASSPKQLKEFFYSRLRLPEQHSFVKGERKVTTNREALEKLDDYFHARVFVRCILKLRDLQKKISVLTTEVSADGRMRTSYNVTGTETGRWSSSRSVEDTGGNLQNITENLRDVFISDTGKKLGYIDLSQAESRALGFLCWKLFRDASYLDACESGDLHTLVAKMVWPELPWTGDPAKDREIAEWKFYLHFSYRDLSKRGGHGTNYYGTPRTMARHLKVRTEIIENFQSGYFSAFPGIPEYHKYCAREIGTRQYLETPLGMGRHFFGRPDDDTTLREGIAFIPQSMVGQLLNLALWRVWKHLPEVELLGQVHDAIVIQYDEAREDELIPRVLELMATPLTAHGRTVIIPADAATGWNWKKFNDKPQDKKGKPQPLNLDGLKSWKGHDDRRRETDPNSSGLDRIISSVL